MWACASGVSGRGPVGKSSHLHSQGSLQGGQQPDRSSHFTWSRRHHEHIFKKSVPCREANNKYHDVDGTTPHARPQALSRGRPQTRSTMSRLAAPIIDLERLSWYHARRPPPEVAVKAVQHALKSASVWRVTNHGMPQAAADRLKAAGKRFFDQRAEQKRAYAVGQNMDRSRGWELYPQHWRFHASTMELLAKERPSGWDRHLEPSAREGILCERFVCGPPTICSDAHRRPFHPFYDSDFGRVFYERNVWPAEENVPAEERLRASMENAYAALEPVAAASLQCLAAACQLPHDAFDHLITSRSSAHPDAPLRHHSRLQLNNYPSQLRARRDHKRLFPIRASRHLDTALLSVLCRDPHVDSGDTAQTPGSSGALEVQLHGCPDHGQDDSWACVPAIEGELTVFVGSLATVLTGFAVRPTTHRVSNPALTHAAASRRMSLGYVLKPDYTAPAVAVAMAERLGAAKLSELEVPCVGLMGRVGWQNHTMQTQGISRQEAVAGFKTWKIAALGRLRSLQPPSVSTAHTHS